MQTIMSFSEELFIFLQYGNELKSWIETNQKIAVPITSGIAIFLIFCKLRLFSYITRNICKCCNCLSSISNCVCRKNKKNKSVLSHSNESTIASDVINELQLSQSCNIEKRNIEELTEQLQIIKSLEQELSSQKLLNHYTEIKLKKKEKECVELQKLEQNTANRNRELMNENVSISKKNGDLIKYCENKMSKCRNQYEKQQQKLFNSIQKNKHLQQEITDIKDTLSQNLMYKNECTKLRANISSLKSQIRQNNKKISAHQTENNSLKNKLETQKHRLNDTSKQFSKLNSDLILYKQENKRIKGNISKHKDTVRELQVYNEELIAENEEIKKQIERFSKQLQQQSKLQNEIIDIQQQLTAKKVPLLLSTNSQGGSSFTAITNAENILMTDEQ
eukprot:218913_1